MCSTAEWRGKGTHQSNQGYEGDDAEKDDSDSRGEIAQGTVFSVRGCCSEKDVDKSSKNAGTGLTAHHN